MRTRESRYIQTRLFTERDRFDGFRERQLTLPDGLVEHMLNSDDRLDHMADNYYKKDRRWWRVLDANADFLYGFDVMDETNEGEVIVIPASRDNS